MDGGAPAAARGGAPRYAAAAHMTTSAGQRSTWDTIVQRALLGTERTASPAQPVGGDLGSLLARVDGPDAELALLAAAALVGAYEAAGRLPARASSAAVAPATPESD